MPITIHELDNGWGNVIKFEGDVASEELDYTITEHLSKPNEVLKKYHYSILDATQVEKFDVELKYIKKIASHSLEVSKVNPDVIVVIATNNEIAFNIARLWGFLISTIRWNVQAFRTREELDKWLLMKMKDIYDISDLNLDHPSHL